MLPVHTAKELARSKGRHPIPAGAEVTALDMKSTGYSDRNKIQPALHAIFGKSASLPSLITTDEAKLFVMVGPDKDGKRRPMGVVGQVKSNKDGWMRVFPISQGIAPQRSSWVSFTYKDKNYIRSVGVSPVRGRRLRLVTFFVHDGELHTDIQDLR